MSTRVVKVSIARPSPPATSNTTSAPSDRPIHSRWSTFDRSGQSRSSRLSTRASAYAVILRYHWLITFCVTTVSQRSHRSPSTCSNARTVRQDGHQMTGDSRRSASPASKSFTKIHCVQR